MYGMDIGLREVFLGFIAVAVLAPMMDQLVRVLEGIMNKLPHFPDQFEKPVAYLMLVGISSWICWQGHFDMFTLFGLRWWQHPEIGWILTGAMIGGGSSLLGKQFRMVGLMPTILGGVSSMLGLGSYGNYAPLAETKTDITPEELNQHD
jgi:hypothetical protein